MLAVFIASSSAELKTPEGSAQPASAYVKPLDLSILAERFGKLPKRDRELIGLYLKGARRYVLTVSDGAFPNGGTEHWRNIAERAHGAAVLAAMPSDWPAKLRTRCREESAAFVKEFTAQFKNKHDLGNPWQSSWWVGELGMAAWFLWDRLDPSLREDVAEMVVFHADRIAASLPGARVHNDTEAETVSWNSTILSLAANMLPTHPHNAKWQEAAKRYVYTVFGTSADLRDSTPGDDGRPVMDWVVGANLNDDFSLENHSRFHIDYVFAAYRFIIQGAALYRLAGNAVPLAFSHHIEEVHEKVLCQCLNGSKFAVYVSDNDWKRYHVWAESAAVHGFVALMKSSPLAAALEEQALREASSLWREFPENFEYDNPYVCGKAWTPRIADIVLLRLFSPPSVKPMSAAAMESILAGAHQKQDVHLLSQYSKAGGFRSFFWGPGPVVRQVEARANPWMLLPLSGNYRAAINGKPAFEAGAKTVSGKGADWFWVMRSYTNGQQEAFVSLPDEIVVMMTSVPESALKGAKTVSSAFAIEKPHKTFTIHYEGGNATYHYGHSQWERSDNFAGQDLHTAWINLDDSIGYVNLNLSHEASHMILPKPGVRSAASLFHVTNPRDSQQFITIALPNQTHGQTKAMPAQVTGDYADGVMTCRLPGYFLRANFEARQTTVKPPADMKRAGDMKMPPKAVGILRMNNKNKGWEVLK
jgi:hypothetical protein